MTDETRVARRRGYPYVPRNNWRDLRARFLATPPRGEVNAGYLAGVLGIGEGSAKNLVPSLRALGLVDGEGRATERAMAWRDDEHYAETTRLMLEEVYPQALRDIAPPPNPDRETARRWFMRDLNTGEAAADKLASFYVLLAAGDPTAGDEAAEHPRERHPRPRPGTRRASETRRARRDAVATPSASTSGQASTASPTEVRQRTTSGPSLHVDIQVHIDPAAPADQIDAIFESMARHLFDRD